MSIKRIPAIRGNIGSWIYYLGTLTFTEINDYVKKIDNELHQAKCLSDAIQRSITTNYKEICNYILSQDERFFNSLVLAIYDGDPEWIEVELDFGDEEFFNLGILSLNGDEKIFPVDGQHRVEGIKASLKKNGNLSTEKVPVIFIGHKKDNGGMQKTRRLFSTLNRYAKPVSMSDIVALDEDDTAAIITRYLVENFPLFQGNRVVFSQQKAIPDTNKVSLTSLITLYQCNVEIVKFYFLHYLRKNNKYKNVKIIDFFKYRPNDDIVAELRNFCELFWKSFENDITDVNNFLHDDSDNPATIFRNTENGGNILFRPIGLLPFVQAILKDSENYNFGKIHNFDFHTVISGFCNINFNLNSFPWKNVAWDPINKTMKTSGNKKLIFLLFYYLANLDNLELISAKDQDFIAKYYASFMGYTGNSSNINLRDLASLVDLSNSTPE